MALNIRKLRLVEDHVDAPEVAAGPRIRVVIATQDSQSLNAHFNSARTFVVYEVTPGTSRFVEAIGFDDRSDESGDHAAGQDRLDAKVAAIAGCNLLLVQAIGAGAAAKIVKAGIHPIKISTPEPIASVVEKVQGMMANPPPWLRKAMDGGARRSMQFLDEED